MDRGSEPITGAGSASAVAMRTTSCTRLASKCRSRLWAARRSSWRRADRHAGTWTVLTFTHRVSRAGRPFSTPRNFGLGYGLVVSFSRSTVSARSQGEDFGPDFDLRAKLSVSAGLSRPKYWSSPPRSRSQKFGLGCDLDLEDLVSFNVSGSNGIFCSYGTTSKQEEMAARSFWLQTATARLVGGILSVVVVGFSSWTTGQKFGLGRSLEVKI